LRIPRLFGDRLRGGLAEPDLVHLAEHDAAGLRHGVLSRLEEVEYDESGENAMEYRTLGTSGPRVSLVGLGCNNFGRRIDYAASQPVVHKALDLGVTLFDTADVYRSAIGGSEEFLGRALGPRRKDIMLATKVGMPMEHGRHGASRQTIIAGVEASLRRLDTDWIDLYQQHQPDPLTPIEETLRAFDDLIRQGKVRYIGCSNFKAWQVVEARWTSRALGLASFVTCQDEYSLLTRRSDRELIPMMQAYGMGLLPYYPLASGALTGKYRRNESLPEGARLTVHGARYGDRFLNDATWPILERLEEFAAACGRTLLELAFSWLAARPCVSSIIAGATRPEQLAANVRAVEWTPAQHELEAIDRITAGGQSPQRA
jgi:aryl-alcohol dehydrogenase-like predicted oxidoreductase